MYLKACRTGMLLEKKRNKSLEHNFLVNSIGRGGAERQLSYIAHLKEIKYVLCIEPLTEYPIPQGKQVIFTNHLSEEKKYQKFIQLISLPFKLFRYIDRNTHLICFLQLSYIIGYLLKRLRGCTFTITVRTNPWGFYQQSPGFKLPFWIYKHLLKQADYVVTNSKETAFQINERVKTKHPAFAISNGYDLERIDQLAKDLPDTLEPIFQHARVILSVGRLYEDKGQWHLIRIFKALKQQYPDIKLVILGKGPLIHPLCSLAAALQLSVYRYDVDTNIDANADIYFLGFNNNPYPFMKRSFLFLFPSLFEGLPNSPIESMCCSLPVLLADCPTGPREIIFPENNFVSKTNHYQISEYGMLFPPFNGEKIWDNRTLIPTEQLWVEGACRYFDDSEFHRRTKTACFEARKHYSLQETLSRWQAFLQQVERA